MKPRFRLALAAVLLLPALLGAQSRAIPTPESVFGTPSGAAGVGAGVKTIAGAGTVGIVAVLSHADVVTARVTHAMNGRIVPPHCENQNGRE